MSEFYDRLASFYHLIFQNWDESIERQAGQLTSIIHQRWGAGSKTILDVSCGIGTRAIGLAERVSLSPPPTYRTWRSPGLRLRRSAVPSRSTSRFATCGLA